MAGGKRDWLPLRTSCSLPHLVTDLLYYRIVFFQTVVFVVIVLVAFETPAAAYLDPGTGSMLLQALLGGVAAAGVIARLYWRRVTTAIHDRLQRAKR